MKFSTDVKNHFTLVEFDLAESGGVITPDDLREITPPLVDARKGVIISGRGPVWLFATLAHFYHPTKWVAAYDPRLGGGVVVQSHDENVDIGDVIPVE